MSKCEGGGAADVDNESGGEEVGMVHVLETSRYTVQCNAIASRGLTRSNRCR